MAAHRIANVVRDFQCVIVAFLDLQSWPTEHTIMKHLNAVIAPLLALAACILLPATVGLSQPAEKAADTVFAPLPQAVSSFGAALSDGWIYVYGGHIAKTHQYHVDAVVNTFQRLNATAPEKWEALPAGPPAQGLALVAHQGKLYRIGGMQPQNKKGEKSDNISLSSCARFDPKTNKWDALPDLPAPRSSHDAVVAGDKIIVVGGWKQNGAGKKADWHSTTLVLDLAKKPLQWQSISQPFQRRALTAAYHNGKVHVIAGIAKDGLHLTVNIFDPIQQTWSTGPDMPGPKKNAFAAASCVAGGRLFISVADGRIFRLAKQSDAWEEVSKLRHPRLVHRMIGIEPNVIVTLGGGSPQGNIAATEAWLVK